MVVFTLLFLAGRFPGYLHYLPGGMATLFLVLLGVNTLLRPVSGRQTDPHPDRHQSPAEGGNPEAPEDITRQAELENQLKDPRKRLWEN